MSSKPTKSSPVEDEVPFYVRKKADPLPFHKFLWNREKGTVLGRTALSWAKILSFYLVFYSGILAFMAILMAVFFQTIDDRVPKWKLEESLIGASPGLSMRPSSSLDYDTLISLKSSNFEEWTKSLDSFLDPYKNPDQNTQNCDSNSPPDGKVCAVNITDFSPCTTENHYGYNNSSPCIFLKLNKIFDWTPDFYDKTTERPKNIPKDLNKTIVETSSDTVWVSCEVEKDADKDKIGTIKYYPSQGFPGFYYPFKNIEGYLSPLVAVQFENPTKGVTIKIECKAWARNIQHDRKDKRGLVRFELRID